MKRVKYIVIYTDKTVSFAPAFNDIRQQGMTKTKGRRRKRSQYVWVRV